MFLHTENRWHSLTLALLLLFAAALPHSIAAAQTAVGLAAAVWLAGLAIQRRRPARSDLDIPILLFVAASILAAVFSLEPAVSVAKLKATCLMLLIPLTADAIRNRQQAMLLVGVLLGSATVGAAPVVWEKIVGRGVEVVALEETSPLRRAGVLPSDIVLACNGEEINRPQELRTLLSTHEAAGALVCQAMRGGILPYEFRLRAEWLREAAATEHWGYRATVGRSIRARGTYGHWTTYAEVLLQLAALACGLWLAYPGKRRWPGVLLAAVPLLLGAALAATFTRASWAALALAVLAMVWVKLGWRGRVAALGVVVLTIGAMNELLVRWRGVGFYNPADLSMQYRRMMWADGLRLMGEHPWLGVGMDTVTVRWRELGLRAYEQFGLQSHFHSTPIQLGVERGLLGLAAWLIFVAAYLRVLFRLLRGSSKWDWLAHGIALGIFGGVCGFLTSGLLHYNLGDSEVAMVLWLLAGVTLSLAQFKPETVA